MEFMIPIALLFNRSLAVKILSRLLAPLAREDALEIQLLKGYRIKFQKFAAQAHKDALINKTFIPTLGQISSLSTELSFIFYRACGHSNWGVTIYV